MAEQVASAVAIAVCRRAPISRTGTHAPGEDVAHVRRLASLGPTPNALRAPGVLDRSRGPDDEPMVT